MSRWRLLTGTSTGSQTVPPEWWRWGAGVGQLHEVAEVLDRAVAPAAVEVAHERRAVVRGEDRVHPADLDVALRVARVLGELARRGRLDDLAAHPAREADALAVDVGAGVAEQAERVGVAAELDADLLEDRVGVVLDEREALLAEDLERGELPGQERDVLGMAREPERPGGRRGRRSAAAAGRPSGVLPRCRSPRSAGAVARCPGVGSGGAGRGRARPAAARPPRGAGSRRVLCGNAIASTKCSWKRGSTAVSIFSTRRTTPSISRPRRARQQGDQRAGPGRVAGRPDVGEVAVGDEPEDHRVERVDLAAEGAGQPDLVDGRRSRAGPSAAGRRRTARPCASWMARTSFWVIDDARPAPAVAVVEDVAERPAVGDDPRRARGERAVDDAVRGDDRRRGTARR